jgi:hypothetical protein
MDNFRPILRECYRRQESRQGEPQLVMCACLFNVHESDIQTFHNLDH